MHIGIVKGKVKWFWRIRARNGEILLSSQGYYSRWSAKRTAQRLADVNRMRIVYE
jgi:uncharacterized protein YegP (UPF0339 family)